MGGGEGEGILVVVADDRGTGCTSRDTVLFLFFDRGLRFFLLIGPGIGAATIQLNARQVERDR